MDFDLEKGFSMLIKLDGKKVDLKSIINNIENIISNSNFDIVVKLSKNNWIQFFKEDEKVSLAYRNGEKLKYKYDISEEGSDFYSNKINKFIDCGNIRYNWDEVTIEKQKTFNILNVLSKNCLVYLIIIMVSISLRKFIPNKSSLFNFLNTNYEVLFSIAVCLTGFHMLLESIIEKEEKIKDPRKKIFPFFAPVFILFGILAIFRFW